MNNELTFSQQQQQRQLISARQKQALEFLQLPQQDISAALDDILAANPLLEESFDPENPAGESVVAEEKAPETEDEASFEELLSDSDSWSNELPVPGSDTGNQPDIWSSIAAPGPDLEQMLETEVSGSTAPENIRDLARVIIHALDERGYLETPLADIAMSCDADMDEAAEALALVQSFDPPGIGARDIEECLAIQLRRMGKYDEIFQRIFEIGLEKVSRTAQSALAKQLGVAPDVVSGALAVLRKLDPAPGGEYSRNAVYIQPEMEFFADENGVFSVRLLNARERKLVISQHYIDLLDDPSLSADDRAFVTEKIRAAKEVIQALELRKNTLLQLGELIAEYQQKFFRQGVKALNPMTMKQAGDILGVHETTVSRAVSGKYALTPGGLLPLKYFFTGGYTAGENTVSTRAVMERIRELVDNESPDAILSDEKIVGILKSEGVSIARRTVAKYRDKLGILPSSLRGGK